MNTEPINFSATFSGFDELWSPRVIAQLNDYEFKLARIKGDFVWHRHPETDEAFIVLDGAMRIDLRDGSVTLGKGEMFVVPKGVEHKPFAEEECRILLVEPRGTLRTGEANWVNLASCSRQYQADMLVQSLREAGIPALAQGPQAGIFGYGFGASTPQGILVMVPSDTLEQAKLILDEIPAL